MSDGPLKTVPDFGKKLRARRQKMKIRQVDLANMVFIDPSTLANIESGEYLPSLPVYRALCKPLELSPGKLLER